ncbi:MAG: flagellin [Geothrix sp.]|nr:flagellin [Geothrix sp.]
MSGSILNNVSALNASRQLGITGQGLDKAIERLTSGKRINRASDDAAGLAIANRLGADVRVAGQGRRNANDGISYLQVADGVTEEITNLLTRAAELAEQAASGTSGADNGTGKTAINAEYMNIIATINDIDAKTNFNGGAIFGATLSVAVGDYTAVSLVIGQVDATTLMAGAAGNMLTASGASAELLKLQTALTNLSAERGKFGAAQQQLTSLSNSLGIQVENFTAAYSQIKDANIADEVVALNKFQVLNQSGINALSQANQASQSILQLLR